MTGGTNLAFAAGRGSGGTDLASAAGRGSGGTDLASAAGQGSGGTDLASAAGQATVELVAFLPLVLAAALAAAALLAGHAATEQAGQAAQAGAMALLQDRDPREAARRALPSGARSRATIVVEDRRVTVTVRPGVPLDALATTLTAKETADAGPP